MAREHSHEEARLAETLDLMDAAVRLIEERLRREHPEATEEEIRGLLSDWLRQHEGATHSDGPGQPAPAERMRRLKFEEPGGGASPNPA
ncbi:MAG: hypothetical protein AB1486_25965 [Planctomycetota bacterium]